MYYKQLYVFDQEKPLQAVIRNYVEQDFDTLIQIQRASFPPPFPEELWWNKAQLSNHVNLFPEGALCVEVERQVVGSVTGHVVALDAEDMQHTWKEITDNGYIRNHNPEGDTLYIVDLCISPNYRKLGLGKWLMQSMYEVVVHRRLHRLLGGGRMSGYHHKAAEMTAEQYLHDVMRGELIDPVITFMLRCGRTPRQMMEDYLPDEQSCNYAVLMEWNNPFISLSSK